jgi:hypothetical protein
MCLGVLGSGYRSWACTWVCACVWHTHKRTDTHTHKQASTHINTCARPRAHRGRRPHNSARKRAFAAARPRLQKLAARQALVQGQEPRYRLRGPAAAAALRASAAAWRPAAAAAAAAAAASSPPSSSSSAAAASAPSPSAAAGAVGARDEPAAAAGAVGHDGGELAVQVGAEPVGRPQRVEQLEVGGAAEVAALGLGFPKERGAEPRASGARGAPAGVGQGRGGAGARDRRPARRPDGPRAAPTKTAQRRRTAGQGPSFPLGPLKKPSPPPISSQRPHKRASALKNGFFRNSASPSP